MDYKTINRDLNESQKVISKTQPNRVGKIVKITRP